MRLVLEQAGHACSTLLHRRGRELTALAAEGNRIDVRRESFLVRLLARTIGK
jgi:hypothetical protein